MQLDRFRVLLGLFIAPWVAPPAFAVGGRLLIGGPFQVDLLTFGCALLVAYVGIFALGMPFVYLLAKYDWLSFVPVVIWGAVAGAIALSAFIALLGVLLQSSPDFDWFSVAWGAPIGLVVSATFCLIAGIRFRMVGDVAQLHDTSLGRTRER